MIRLQNINKIFPDLSAEVVLLADTSAEIPATGAQTYVKDLSYTIAFGSKIYTADFMTGVLKSNDTWVWTSTGGGGAYSDVIFDGGDAYGNDDN